MNRMTVSRRHLAGTLFALLLLLALGSSCSKDRSPIAPDRTTSGSARGPGGLGGGFSSGLPTVPSEAAISMVPGASLTQLMNDYNLELVTSLPMPATGSFSAKFYYLVHEKDDKALSSTSLSLDARLAYYSDHNRVWMPEDDRGGLSFDDANTWRTGGDYLGQPSISQVSIPAARPVTEGAGEVIAILDTGVDVTHPLFTASNAHFVSGGNYTVFPPVGGMAEPTPDGVNQDEDEFADDGVGHGTHVAGIVFTGARQATFRIYKVLDAEGRGTAFGLAKAMKSAADYGADVINLSLGLNTDDDMIQHVIEYCQGRGVAVVASAGNRFSEELQYPAAYPGVFSVTAVDNQDVKANFASYGVTIDVAAPGVNVISPIPSVFGAGKYAIASGTSMATPFVSSAIAVTHAVRSGTLTPLESGNYLMTVTDDINPMNPGYVGKLGSGRVDFGAAVTIP